MEGEGNFPCDILESYENHYSTVQDENVIDLEWYFKIDGLELKNLVKKFRKKFLKCFYVSKFCLSFPPQ